MQQFARLSGRGYDLVLGMNPIPSAEHSLCTWFMPIFPAGKVARFFRKNNVGPLGLTWALPELREGLRNNMTNDLFRVA